MNTTIHFLYLDFDNEIVVFIFFSAGSRKRRAIQEVFGSPSSGGNANSQKEEAWQIDECIWVYEQQPQDTAIAKIVSFQCVSPSSHEYFFGKKLLAV